MLISWMFGTLFQINSKVNIICCGGFSYPEITDYFSSLISVKFLELPLTLHVFFADKIFGLFFFYRLRLQGHINPFRS